METENAAAAAAAAFTASSQLKEAVLGVGLPTISYESIYEVPALHYRLCSPTSRRAEPVPDEE